MRSVIPFIMVHGQDTKIYSKQLTASVVGFYLSVLSAMSIIITIFPISIGLAALTENRTVFPVRKFDIQMEFIFNILISISPC